jgi:succinate dehydrogenase / fumarate reductase cytochrome b subunit
MSWLSTTFSSSLGKKLIMALTGLFLCTFLVVHLIGNLQLLKADGGQSFNLYAKFMTSNPLIKTTSYLLYASILGHAIWGLLLTLKNKKARPVGYYASNNASTWNSRNMGILGTIVLAFIVGHMGDFWWEYKFEEGFPVQMIDGVEYKDLYKEVIEAFHQSWLVALYTLAMVAISFHLHHGFQSAFQTLGVNHKKYTPFIKGFGAVFAYIIPAAFAAIPLIILIRG